MAAKKKNYVIESSSEDEQSESDVSVMIDEENSADSINELMSNLSRINLDTVDHKEEILVLSSGDEKEEIDNEIVQKPKKKSLIQISSDDESDTENGVQVQLSNPSRDSLDFLTEFPAEIQIIPKKELSPEPVPQIPVGKVKPKTKAKNRLNLEKMAELLEKENIEKKKPVKKILNFYQLEKETRAAERAEKDRRKRIEARQELFENYFPDEGASSGILDFNMDTKKVLVKINKAFVPLLKPHQLEGIKFLYDCIIESVDRFNEDDLGSGCILAHSMGLGKTFQIVVFLHSIMINRHLQDKMERVLIIVPYNVIENWAMEFEKWFEKCDISWQINMFEFRNAKTLPKRVDMLKRWFKRGGILLITNTLFSRIISNPNDKQLKSQAIIKQTLLSPGPDLVIIDEGHLLKNDDSSFNLALNLIETQRRIVLTGTPLQNNLIEYFVMVDFVKPQLLGTKKEFKNRFQNPVTDGQHMDSTPYEVQMMKKRIHVLYQMLKGCIHRQDYHVLVPYLQPKFEYVLSVKMNKEQIDMYKHYLQWYVDPTQKAQKNFLRDKQLLSLVWTHPALMHDYYTDSEKNKKENFATTIGDWYLKYVDLENIYNINLSAKFTLLFVILEMCEKAGDKIVVFSQSLLCLNLIERFLRQKMKAFNKEQGLANTNYEDILKKTGGVSHRWISDVDYFRIDGGVETEERSSIIGKFNDVDNPRARLMLVSTRAGGIGTNLIGANRAIIFDASFNPSHDLQAIFRIYRLGQTKPVFVYRFTVFGTMEDKIYKRQIVKQSLSGRVVDEQQILRHYSQNDILQMYQLDTNYGEENVHPVSEDNILNDILLKHSDLIISYHEHDSLLENRPEEELSEEERKAAWVEYETQRKTTEVIKLGPEVNLNKPPMNAPIQLNPNDINIIDL